MSKYSELEPRDNPLDTHSLEPVRMAFAGHRGFGARQVQPQRAGNLRFPENSLISLQKVMESGAEFIEFDLYLSQDQHLMVIHDDDLSINAKYIVQRENEMRHPEGGFYHTGDLIDFPPGRTFVHDLPSAYREVYDISGGIDIPNGVYSELYRTIPEFHEVLELVSAENVRRIESGWPRVKLNVELKGVGTGAFVQKAIEDFNSTKDHSQQIRQDEIYYMSFLDRELAMIAGLMRGSEGTPVPTANLILGVPTNVQYNQVGQDYAIEEPTLNYNLLGKRVEPLHYALRQLEGRNGIGLTGVDVSLWDVGNDSIEYFCGRLGIPIHIAVVPFEANDFKQGHIEPALNNISKIAEAQGLSLRGDHIMIVKTDNPMLLQDIMKQEHIFSRDVEILKVAPRRRKEVDRSWLAAPDLISYIEAYTGSKVTQDIANENGLRQRINEAMNGIQDGGNNSYIIPINQNPINGEIALDSIAPNHTNHWTALRITHQGNRFVAEFIDPMGRDASEQILNIVSSTLGIDRDTIQQPLSGHEIQHVRPLYKEDEVIGLEGNDYDCGPLLVYALSEVSHGRRLPLERGLTEQESRSFGQGLRQALAQNDNLPSIDEYMVEERIGRGRKRSSNTDLSGPLELYEKPQQALNRIQLSRMKARDIGREISSSQLLAKPLKVSENYHSRKRKSLDDEKEQGRF